MSIQDLVTRKKYDEDILELDLCLRKIQNRYNRCQDMLEQEEVKNDELVLYLKSTGLNDEQIYNIERGI